MQLRHDWTRDEIRAVYEKPFPELVFQAAGVHREHFDPTRVQRSTLLSVKTGGCPENCAYCPQSAHYDTGVERHGVLPTGYVLEKARAAQAEGSTRFCMGAAWREVKDGKDFDAVLELVESVAATGMEVCCTLGMLTESQARRLKEAGCHAYNHNLDTSPEFYGSIITTRTYDDRLRTLRHVRAAGITVCCGGIIGMGETVEDRLGLLEQLSRQNPHPESVPINALQRVEGTPLAEREAVDPLEFVRMVATARILMPASYVRLSAGRIELSEEAQALCFLAGANSIFAGDKLLTQKNPGDDRDRRLLGKLGMHYAEGPCAAEKDTGSMGGEGAARTHHLMVST
ncbi:MAG TPA: biotin synthase BioB [Phycisphaerae bacterium]|nr:biotin synthase BioB [Phycisphaerae bacterium]